MRFALITSVHFQKHSDHKGESASTNLRENNDIQKCRGLPCPFSTIIVNIWSALKATVRNFWRSKSKSSQQQRFTKLHTGSRNRLEPMACSWLIIQPITKYYCILNAAVLSAKTFFSHFFSMNWHSEDGRMFVKEIIEMPLAIWAWCKHW